MIRFIRRHTRVVRLALLAALAAGALACGPAAGIGGGGAGVDVAIPVCTVNIVKRPTLEGLVGVKRKTVVATVNLSCIAPQPLTHHADVWLAPNGDGSGDPRKAVWGVAGMQHSDVIPDAEGITFYLEASCSSISPAKRTWRVDVETAGLGPPSKAAPKGIPFAMNLDKRPEDMKPTDLTCQFN